MAKRKKNYLPKRVGRVKIPKRLRRGVLGATISSAAGQAIIAALVLKGGSHLIHLARTASDPERGSATDAAVGDVVFDDRAPRPLREAPPADRPAPTLNIKHALGQAAIAFVLGLSHPKSPARSRRPNAAPEPASAPDRGNGTERMSEAPRPAAPSPGESLASAAQSAKLGAHSH